MRDPQEIFPEMDGLEGLRTLVHDFYKVMDQEPKVAIIRNMHPNLKRAEEKLYRFLVQRFTGQPLYSDLYGPARMRMRHKPFPIGQRERDEWLYCMNQAINSRPWDEKVKDEIFQFFVLFAEKMRNQ